MIIATTSRVTVTVTQEHINQGQPCECASCPIALAILAAIPGSAGVAVHWAHAFVAMGEGGTFKLVLPDSANDFMDDFDSDEPVEPFTFTAEVTS